MLFASRGIRRRAQDELAFRHLHTAYPGFDFKLHQVAHVRQLFGAKIYPLPGPNGPKEFHAPDRGKKKHGLRVFGMIRRRGDPRRLRKRFRQDDAGNQRITRKMTGEDRIVRGKRRDRFRGDTGIALDQVAHENKWRAVGEAEKVTSDVGQVTSF